MANLCQGRGEAVLKTFSLPTPERTRRRGPRLSKILAVRHHAALGNHADLQLVSVFKSLNYGHPIGLRYPYLKRSDSICASIGSDRWLHFASKKH